MSVFCLFVFLCLLGQAVPKLYFTSGTAMHVGIDGLTVAKATRSCHFALCLKVFSLNLDQPSMKCKSKE